MKKRALLFTLVLVGTTGCPFQWTGGSFFDGASLSQGFTVAAIANTGELAGWRYAGGISDTQALAEGKELEQIALGLRMGREVDPTKWLTVLRATCSGLSDEEGVVITEVVGWLIRSRNNNDQKAKVHLALFMAGAANGMYLRRLEEN